MSEKVFNIRGNPNQIQHAIQLIQEKTGQQGPNDQVSYFLSEDTLHTFFF